MSRTTPLNQRTLSKIFMFLHQRASHDNKAVSARWHQAERRFHNHHMPYFRGRTSANWHNSYTAGGWL